MIHLLLDLTGKRAVVFGGGEVGFRKARYLSVEAEVVIVSREHIGAPLQDVRQIKTEIKDDYRQWIEWADLVVAATDDPELNDEIAQAAHTAGKMFNSADRQGSFLIPATMQREGLSIAISTAGRSPAMARYLRERLESEIGEDILAMIALQEEMRSKAKEALEDRVSREELLWSIIDDQKIWTLLLTDPEAARRRAMDHLEVMRRTPSLVLT